MKKDILCIICGILLCICITPKEDKQYYPLEMEEVEYEEPQERHIEFHTCETYTPSYYDITEYEQTLLAKLLWTEARGESVECQRAVVSVIFNRLEYGYWGNTIEQVIKAQGQFDLGNKLDNVKPGQTQYEVVDYVVENGSTLPGNVIYFRAGYYHEWATNYCKIDHTYFSSR